MPVNTSANKRNVGRFLRVIMAVVALFLAFYGENLKEVFSLLLKINALVMAGALLIYLLSQIIFVMRWYLLLRVQGIRIRFFAAIKLHFIGLFYNNCLPGAIGGDLLRAWYVTKHTEKKTEAAFSVIADRAIGLVGIFIMAFISYFFLPAANRISLFHLSLPQIDFADYGPMLIITGFLAIAMLVFILATGKGRRFSKRIKHLISEHGHSVMRKLITALSVYYDKKMALMTALLLTFACQGLFIIGLWMIGKEIGVDVSMRYYFIFFPISWLLGSLPISIGGLGITEGWLKLAFGHLANVSGASALALALGQRILWLTGSLPGLIIHLAGGHLPKDFLIDSDDTVN